MRPEEEIAKAREALKVVESPLIQGCFAEMDRMLLDQLVASPVEATGLRDKIWALLCMRRKFEEMLRIYADRGKLAEDDIASKRDWQRRNV
jgi:hypothetical protein